MRLFLALFLFASLAQAKTKIVWSVGVDESGKKLSYEGAEVEPFVKKPLTLKTSESVCQFSKVASAKPIENERLGVTCVLGGGAYIIRTEAACVNVPGYVAMIPLIVGKPNPAKAGKPEEAAAMVTISCSVK